MDRRDGYDAVVIGGGFYGCSIARHLATTHGASVVLLEADSDLLTRASYANQARVHQGYHYPRSLLTALRSRVNFTRFVEQYRDAIVDAFDMYYAVARHQSNVTADQFVRFCMRIGAPIDEAPAEIARLFSAVLIERVFRVREYAFDADVLRRAVKRELELAGVHVVLGSRASAARAGQGMLVVRDDRGRTYETRRVFNCTYSALNGFLTASGLSPIPLKHELTELALVEVPETFKAIGITVMCGPFFSLMPFPARGLHSLSHVRYTPHSEWQDGLNAAIAATSKPPKPRSRFVHMLLDARRFIPSLTARHVDSLWEIKTVLPRSDVDDSRPILHRRHEHLPSLTCVLGSKIDSVYDVLDEITAAS